MGWPSHIVTFLYPSVPCAHTFAPWWSHIHSLPLYAHYFGLPPTPPLPSHYYHDHPTSEILPVRQGYLRREAHGSAKSIVRSLFTTSSQKYGQRFVAPKHVCAAGSRGRGQGTCYNAFRRGLTLMLFRSTASEGPLQDCCIVSSANTSIHAYIHEPSM